MSRRFAQFTLRCAVVTGAASGIGAREVERLRAADVSVVGADRSEAVASMRSGDPGFIGIAGDVRHDDFAPELVECASQHFGPVDLLFHSAGIMPGGKVGDVDTATFHRVMEVNYGGTVRAVKAALPGMRERGRGQIVVLGSLTGYVPTRGFAAYSASKAAVNTFVETTAYEEAGHGIQVLLVAPNAVKTPLLQQASAGPALVRRLAAAQSSPLMITTDQVLDAVDRALEAEHVIVTPGGRLAHAARKIAPSIVWRIDEKLGA